jgi:hypothetical protein
MEILMPTPYLDEIQISKWFNTKYNIFQILETENLIEYYIWVTARRVQIPVKMMTISHINNTIKCWNGQGKLHIPAGYLGGKEKWLKIFNQELLNRQ